MIAVKEAVKMNIVNGVNIVCLNVLVFLAVYLNLHVRWYVWVGVVILYLFSFCTWFFASTNKAEEKLLLKRMDLENDRLEAQTIKLRRK